MKILFIAFTFLLVIGCTKGKTSQTLQGTEEALPPELKGLKVYNVTDDGMSTIKVAILNNQVNSLTYFKNDATETVVVLNKDSYDQRIIKVKQIISENDSIIVIRK